MQAVDLYGAGALSKDGLTGAPMPEAGASGRTSYRWSYSIQTCVGESIPRMTDPRARTVRFIGPKSAISDGFAWRWLSVTQIRAEIWN